MVNSHKLEVWFMALYSKLAYDLPDIIRNQSCELNWRFSPCFASSSQSGHWLLTTLTFAESVRYDLPFFSWGPSLNATYGELASNQIGSKIW